MGPAGLYLPLSLYLETPAQTGLQPPSLEISTG